MIPLWLRIFFNRLISVSSQVVHPCSIAALNTFRYFSGNARGFICALATMCVVSPSASNVVPSAFNSS